MSRTMLDTSTWQAATLAAGPDADPRPGSVEQPGWSPARLAYWFYGVAATGAVIGQTWVAVTHGPWPATVPAAARVAAVLPFALCLELLAMALAAMADQRMRIGERAYGFRVFSAMVAMVAVGILVAGHWPHLYWSGGFGVLSASAYLLWLLHSAARRRDALRAAGKLADTAPDYRLWRRVRHPIWTVRAAELARAGRVDPDSGRWRPLGLYESLRAAQLAIRDEHRRPAIARAVEQVVRADHRDPRMADLAVQTLDLDRLAGALAERVDYDAWADRLAPAITAPPTTTAGPGDGRTDVAAAPLVPDVDAGTVGAATAGMMERPDAVAVAGLPATAPTMAPSEPAETLPPRRPDPVEAAALYRPTSDEDRIMYAMWRAGVAAGAEPSGAELARAAGRPNDDSGVGRRAARRYREAHATGQPGGTRPSHLATAATAAGPAVPAPATGSDADRRNGHRPATPKAAA